MCQSFGSFPEPLLAGYIVQVLCGLRYLHEQGTIHRDIKGANILTNKEGKVKLADFGVATQSVVGTLSRDKAVVGTPYWMAPEVIEVNGATAASDIWSLGCTIVELLTGKPPNYDLDQMAAMYAIVSKETPIPDGISAELKDFLLECFQKDPNLRVSASALQKHPWLGKTVQRLVETQTRYEDAIKTVKIYNSPERDASGYVTSSDLFSPVKSGINSEPIRNTLFKPVNPLERRNTSVTNNSFKKSYVKPVTTYQDDDDDGFADLEGDLNMDRLQAVINGRLSKRQQKKDSLEPTIMSEPMIRQTSLDSQLSDISQDSHPVPDDIPLYRLNTTANVVHQDIHNFSEISDNADYTNDFEDVGAFDYDFSKRFLKESPSTNNVECQSGNSSYKKNLFPESRVIASNSKQELESSASDNDNPFLKIGSLDEGSNEVDRDLRLAHIKMETIINDIDSLPSNSADLKALTIELLNLIKKFPASKSTLIKSHGLLKLCNLFKEATSKTVALNLIEVLAVVAADENERILDDFWLLGGMSAIIRLLSKRSSSHLRREVAALINKTCENSILSLQMYIGCGGLQFLYEFLNEDYSKDKSLVTVGLRILLMVLERISSPMLKKSIYKSLCNGNVLLSIVSVLNIESASSESDSDDIIFSILQLLITMSQEDPSIKSNIGLSLVPQLLASFDNCRDVQRTSILKFIKNISQEQSSFSPLIEDGIINKIISILKSTTEKLQSGNARETINQAIPIIFNFCRLNSNRQEKAASLGLVPILIQILQDSTVQNRDTIRELSLQLLCDMTHAGKFSRDALWHNDALDLFLTYTSDPFWQRNIYEALLAWLRGDITIERKLSSPSAVEALLDGLKPNTNGASYGDLVSSFGSILRISPLLCKAFPLPKFYSIIRAGLLSSDPLVIVNLLRVLRVVTEMTGSKISDINLRDQLFRHGQQDKSNLVRQLVSDLLKS